LQVFVNDQVYDIPIYMYICTYVYTYVCMYTLYIY